MRMQFCTYMGKWWTASRPLRALIQLLLFSYYYFFHIISVNQTNVEAVVFPLLAKCIMYTFLSKAKKIPQHSEQEHF